MNENVKKYRAPNPKRVQPVEFEDHYQPDFSEFMELPVVATAVASNPMPSKQQHYSNQNEDSGEEDYGDFIQQKKQPERRRSFGGNVAPSASRKNSLAGPPRKGSVPTMSREVSLLSTNLPDVKPWANGLRKKIVDSFKLKTDEHKARQFLQKYRFPEGLVQTVFKSCRKLPLRFFIVDDSGSMLTNDGRRLLSQGNSTKLIKCTRWAELTESMLFLAELSEILRVPSEFRLLNGAEPVIVGLESDQGESIKFLKEVLGENPAGPTPLCTHIAAVVACIASVEKELRAAGQKAVVVIATDGESSDGNVAEALQPLTDVSVVGIFDFSYFCLLLVASACHFTIVYGRKRSCGVLE
jgi:hypothetical protein